MRPGDLPALRQAISDLWGLARDQGLDPLPTHFEVVPAPILYEVAAYGLPGRFSHWSHGKAYQSMKSQYDLGLVKYFELVINGDPAQAFLLDANDLLTDKFVVAHVLGHADFFQRNAHFATTDRDMPARVGLHAGRLRAYEFRHGRDDVESFLEALLAIEEHVDPWAGAPPAVPAQAAAAPGQRDPEGHDRFAPLFPAPQRPRVPRPPVGPGGRDAADGSDLLLFLQRHAPALEDWQRDAIALVREEALYFRPQIRTKIMKVRW